uniref:myelin-oligodendrocyte glycoprotein-like isoform X2 n=1 Tax=Pristiophorus japonicus TaxID=55135 RepID=UPI00398EF22F
MAIIRLLLALSLSVAISESGHLTCEKRRFSLRASAGDTAHLPCLFAWVGPEPSEYMVVWRLSRGEEEGLAHGHEGHTGSTEHGPRFRGRTKLGQDWFARGNASLSLGQLGPSDGGTYTCRITTMNPYQGEECAEVTLSVDKGPGGSDVGNSRSDQVVDKQLQGLEPSPAKCG